MIYAKNTVVKRKNIPYRMIEKEGVIVDVSNNDVVQLNDVAAFVWETIDLVTSVGELVAAVCQEFEVGPDEAYKDTVEFLDQLQKKGLIDINE
ncbi:PqqD family protein [Candidatus Omnitrophota bacterium]